MEFSGLQKLAMVDYPGKLAATVFPGGCNLRCPFCHNAVLVLHPDQAEHLSEADILDFLSRRRGLLDGVVLSGGEPLLHDGAADFLCQVRELGFAVKLDTNGCFPDRLEALLRDGLLDYVAMDIKNSPQKYPQTVGIPGFDLSPVQKSIDLLCDAGVEYEFRTTVVRQLHTAHDILAIGRWLEGAPRYYLQNFVDSGSLISQGFTGFTAEELHGFQALARPFFGEVRLRGVE